MTKTNPFSEFLDATVPPCLIGRDDILRKIFRDLGNQQLRAYEVAAAGHVGSSALLKHLADTDHLFAQEKNQLHRGLNPSNYCPIYVDGGSALDDTSVAEWLLEGIMDAPTAQSLMSDIGFRPSGRPIRDLTLLLKKARRNQLIVFFLIDHFDQRFTSLDTNESVNLRGLTNHASFLIATKRPLSTLNQNAFASWFGSVTTRIDLSPLDQSQRRELIQICLSQGDYQAQHKVSNYAIATSIAGMHPSFILLACQELFELKESLFGIDDAIVHNLLKDRLTAVFQPRFSYYHRHLEREYRESLANLIGNQVTEKDYLKFIDLERLGLLVSSKGPKGVEYAPFSDLFKSYLEIESTVEPAEITIRGDFTPLHKQILKLMVASPNQVIPYAVFLEKVWQKKAINDKNLRLLRETIRNLKKNMAGKIGGEILNHRSVGYEYRVEDQ